MFGAPMRRHCMLTAPRSHTTRSSRCQQHTQLAGAPDACAVKRGFSRGGADRNVGLGVVLQPQVEAGVGVIKGHSPRDDGVDGGHNVLHMRRKASALRASQLLRIECNREGLACLNACPAAGSTPISRGVASLGKLLRWISVSISQVIDCIAEKEGQQEVPLG